MRRLTIAMALVIVALSAAGSAQANQYKYWTPGFEAGSFFDRLHPGGR